MNGNDEDEAALLAELKKISNQSTANRFNEDEDDSPLLEEGNVVVHDDPTNVDNHRNDKAMESDDNNNNNNNNSNASPANHSDESPTAVIVEDAAASRVDYQNTSSYSPAKIEASPPIGNDKINNNVTTTSSTFQGVRGGDAHDEELLALLKGISSSGAASDRFAQDEPEVSGAGGGVGNDGNVDNDNVAPTPTPVVPTTGPTASQKSVIKGRSSSRKNDEDKPWKRRNKVPFNSNNQTVSSSTDNSTFVDVVVAAPESSAATAFPPPPPAGAATATTTTGQQEPLPTQSSATWSSNFQTAPSTFQGERGGDAQDAELLALLRGVSAKSGAADRFGDDDGNNDVVNVNNDDAVAAHSSSSQPTPQPRQAPPPTRAIAARRGGDRGGAVPPWKRGKASKQQTSTAVEVEVVVEAPPPPQYKNTPEVEIDTQEAASPTAAPPAESKNDLLAGAGNFAQKSTFQGERGGDAQDEELLALLRGVSAKSGAHDRFANNGDEPHRPSPTAKPATSKKKATVLGAVSTATRTKSATDLVASEVEANRVEAPSSDVQPGHGTGNFQQTSTFQGERGGDAYDEESLQLLRQAGPKSSGFTDRFSPITTTGTENGDIAPTSQPTALSPPALISDPPPPIPSAVPSTKGAPSMFPNDDDEEEIVLTKDDLPAAFSDKSWKVRKTAYHVLGEVIHERAQQTQPGELDADKAVTGLDAIIPTLLAEKNAAAAEVAMQAVTDYAHFCKGGSSPEQARAIVTALLKGQGFSSPRPSSAKIATALVLKLMEVGSSPNSLTVVASCIVQNGLSSKKPKTVQLSASIVLDAVYSFGAALLPLQHIVSALPKILTHSNKKIRDVGLDILAEFCRALGSKAPMEDVIDKMQKSQIKDLDALLDKHPDPTPIKIGLRCQNGPTSSSINNALDALQAGGEELARERYLNRPPVDLIAEINKTEYASKLKLAKWSEKVAALKLVVQCGGEKPYKLAQPSSSNKYASLISDMKGLLTHTHFAVVSNAMEVLAMLAQGVGEKLYPYLRPLLPKLLQLSKDKKLTKGVASCLDAFFGNVLAYEHLLDPDSSISDAASENKEKNALARTSALEFLDRAVTRGSLAGPRATMTPLISRGCAKLAAHKLEDSDAAVRKAALQVLLSLQKIDDSDIRAAFGAVVEDIKQSNPRVFKVLSDGAPSKAAASTRSKGALPERTGKDHPPPNVPSAPERHPSTKPSASTDKARKRGPLDPAKNGRSFSLSVSDADAMGVPSLEEAVSHCASLGIPKWEESDEDGGILAGIESAKWQSRHSSIKFLSEFVSSRPMLDSCSEIELDTGCILVMVKEHTRGFKETNMNVTRSILELFLALCDFHENARCPFPKWAAVDGTFLSIEKISDRKLSSLSKSLLLSLCVVYPPHVVLESAFENAASLRAPSAHEEFLVWMKTYCKEFGSPSIGPGMKDAASYILLECHSKNIKVKRAALSVLGLIHSQLGPSFKQLVLANIKETALQEEVGEIFIDHPFVPSTSSTEWPKACIFAGGTTGDEVMDTDAVVSGVNLQLPKTDLIAQLPPDCLSRMGAKEGKTAWKARKAALEDVEKVLKGSTGLLDTAKFRGMIDLLRAMKERLSDSQSNLKPVSARLIGVVLGSVEGEEQGKLGKVVYGPLINAAMNDNRKIMHDACMEALKIGTSTPSVVGDGPNAHSLEPFIVALSLQLEDSEFKSAGIAEVLMLAESFTEHLPNLDSVASNRGETLGGRFSRVLVDALSSSKAEIRSAAESLLSECLKKSVFSMQTAKKCTGRLVPAKQRSVGLVLAKIASSSNSKPTYTNNEMDDEDDEIEARIATATTRRPPSRDRGPSTALYQRNVASSAQRTLKSSASTDQVSNTLGDGKRSHHYHNDGARISAVSNPLVSDCGPAGLQKSRAALRSLTWPEYPEEPTGSTLYSGLRKAWAPIIPAESVTRLFPECGIRKQDDALVGFDLLMRAIAMEQAGEGMAVTEQLTLILRWSVFIMCCKESTVGLTGLLDFLAELVHFLVESNYELSDSEAALFVPFVLEKASVAKGRFKDSYLELIRSIKSGKLLPLKRLGPNVCVAVMESSSQAKARLLACQECYACVETIHLSGIGKKGVLVAAKNLSEEKLPEIKAAFLDLMVLLVSRLNNDMIRLSKICGSSLSSKARSMIEERIDKGDSIVGSSPSKLASPPKVLPRNEPSTGRPAHRVPKTNQSTPPSKLPGLRARLAGDISGNPSSFEDELPALDLRTELPSSPIIARTTPVQPSGIQKTSLPSSLPRSSNMRDAEEPPSVPGAIDRPNAGPSMPKTSAESLVTNLFSSSSDSQSYQTTSSVLTSVTSGTSNGGEELGAAASLRARLLKIREKNKSAAALPTTTSAPKDDTVSQISIEKGAAKTLTTVLHAGDVSAVGNEDKKQIKATSIESLAVGVINDEPVLRGILDTIQSLLTKVPPLPESDRDLVAATDVLKNVHAAVSKQFGLGHGFNATQIESLRRQVMEGISEVVSTLTKVIEFGFCCHPTTINAGMSVPLLSVNLASLMAIFRSKDLANLVKVDDLTILIREAGRALLDPRLASPFKSGAIAHPAMQPLDESTSTQMVRAINKLAVQCATGPRFEISIQALTALSEQLSLNRDPNDDQMFNSRLARIVIKLFGRVLKAEESSPEAFSPVSVDIEAVICCLEDTLGKGDEGEKEGNVEGAAAMLKLARSVVLAVLKKRGEASSFRQSMVELEIDPSSSILGTLVQDVAAELGIKETADPVYGKAVSQPTPSNSDIASLVSAVGSAHQGAERDAAVAALKSYRAEFGQEELNAHLQEVSSTFRAFVEEQLSDPIEAVSAPAPPSLLTTNTLSTTSNTEASTIGAVTSSSDTVSMSERIKSLRSKLSATEAAMEKADPASQQQKENKTQAAPKTETVKGFRDRLAAAQEKQRSATTSVEAEGTPVSPIPTTTAGSRAAALRARLQAVKQKNTADEF